MASGGMAAAEAIHARSRVAIGWTNPHRHPFTVGEACSSDTRHHFPEFADDPEILAESTFTLRKIAPRAGEVFRRMSQSVTSSVLRADAQPTSPLLWFCKQE